MLYELKAHIGDLVIINDPVGGPCLWLSLPDGFSSQDLWHYLIKSNLAIHIRQFLKPVIIDKGI
ncbi:hypothetical protein CJF42_19695 [Pseudoalteromonas sp. NBT06-2]|uniref:hypothetical protein n=1 Tax=Pseudoalteromonas sp. NBT06-2 TaxID=2025950 RepID=UPI000BA6046B|nr:hypothetical protein [Pseudoalteromonas sp. NBT06-2]PAJ72726.1 hypothetical protein CJF42_19695 [Pseudoalteromonas sp. NBT06-2]